MHNISKHKHMHDISKHKHMHNTRSTPEARGRDAEGRSAGAEGEGGTSIDMMFLRESELPLEGSECRPAPRRRECAPSSSLYAGDASCKAPSTRVLLGLLWPLTPAPSSTPFKKSASRSSPSSCSWHRFYVRPRTLCNVTDLSRAGTHGMPQLAHTAFRNELP